MDDVTYPPVRANFEARVASGEFQLVSGQRHETGRQFTTQAIIEAERDVIRRMQQGQNQAPQIMPIQNAVALTEARSQLNAAQRNGVEQVLTSRHAIQGLQGAGELCPNSPRRNARRPAPRLRRNGRHDLWIDSAI